MENIIEENLTEKEVIISTDPERLHKVLVVTFEITKKRYYFEVLGEEKYKKNDKVIVETIRGKEIGIASSNPIMMKEKDLVLPLKPVLKLASDKEVETYIEQKLEAEEAFKICKEKISKHQLEMKLITSEYTFDKSKLIFYFTANGRIDFRELVKDLALIFRTRIELRQIGVRDEARILGNIGPCGKELCCKTFINRFDSVSVKMARDQGLVINPTKISGVCGRLLCCINYEYAQYEEALKDFPAVNQSVGTQMGEGKVVSISPLNGFLYIDVQDKGISRFNIEDIKFNRKEASILKNMKSKEEIENRILEKE
ncbi:PSP1 domain-containing protein [Fusobacterium massiliense]|jgi:tpl protein|uniref:PSP1 domain-containing protein n=1 Tax=Fusobacterium massiliense TaxID=1852365 RepID=UPI00093CD606|nr:stage 0 sporulation family protein [Fusobacterium massiliense]